jgi:hypothetical protein
MTSISLPRINWRTVIPAAACAIMLPALVLLALKGQVRIPLAAAVAFPLLALAAVNIRIAILGALVYLIVLGDLRRILIPIAGWSGMDPLLLVGPAFAVIVCAAALGTGTLRLDTPLSRWAAALFIVMALQIFNPAQGGLAVGVAGVIFLMAPLFWFWVGRTYATPELMHRLLFFVVLPFGIAATAFGFVQRYSGYFPYQMEWYWIAGYSGLGRPETGLAPISFFASGTEHGTFLVITGMIIWVIGLRKYRPALILLLPIVFAVLLTGSRGPVVRLLGTAAIVWAVMGENRAAWLPRFGLAFFLLSAGLVWSLTQAETVSLDSQSEYNLERQRMLFGGEDQPEEHSTLAVHGTLLIQSYWSVLRKPLGYGLGATSLAASKFGGPSQSLSTETDVGDVMVATGMVGGVIYHVMIALIMMSAIRYWRGTRSNLALVLLGIIIAQFLLWLGGGLYAVSAIVWVCIGAIDALERDRAREASLLPAPQ